MIIYIQKDVELKWMCEMFKDTQISLSLSSSHVFDVYVYFMPLVFRLTDIVNHHNPRTNIIAIARTGKIQKSFKCDQPHAEQVNNVCSSVKFSSRLERKKNAQCFYIRVSVCVSKAKSKVQASLKAIQNITNLIEEKKKKI